MDPDGRLMRILEESLSLNVQMTEPKAYLAESLPAGMEELMRLYVEPPARERTPRLSGRAAIQARMRSEFEHAGVWDLLRKKIAASEYTRPGDPLRIDVGYRPNGIVRMFHAVVLIRVWRWPRCWLSQRRHCGRCGESGEGGAGVDGGD